MSFAFINLFSTKDEALSYRYSPMTTIYSFNGIQLLPNKEEKYIQTSFTREGVALENWEVFAVSLCGENRTNITENFFIERVFDDDNGIPQIDWSLRNLPELGYGFVYLEINQLLSPGNYADTWYSNIFRISDIDSENTSLIHYRDSIYDTMQSIQLNLYWLYNKKTSEFTSYREVSTRITKTVTATSSKFQMWQTGIVPRDLMILISDLFDLTYMYIDYIRCYPFEPAEIPDPEGSENFGQYTFSLSFSFGDVYNPSEVPPVPVPPSEQGYIDFTRLVPRRGLDINAYFSIYGFVPVDNLYDYQISTDNLNFTSLEIAPPFFTNASTNLKILTLPAYNINYFLRIVANGTIISNTLNIQLNG